MLDQVRIVLVRPLRSGNVGAAARVMMNLGLRDLTIVAPRCDLDDAQAQGFAARAKSVLAAAKIVEDIPAALTDCILTFATSAKGGFYRRNAALTPQQAAPLALEAVESGPVAVAFGPEDQGLVLSDLLSFDRVIEIPADPAYPALNLAAAVAIVCWELRRASPLATPVTIASGPRATDGRKRVMFELLFAALDRIGFFAAQQRPEHLRFALRHMLGRLDLSVNEADILMGMARQIAGFADRLAPRPPAPPLPAPPVHGTSEERR